MKRYRYIYTTRRHRRTSPIVILVLLIGAALALFIGYSIAGPLLNFMSGRLKPSPNTSSVIRSSSRAASSAASSSVPSSGSSQALHTAAIRGIMLPVSYLSDSAKLDAVISSAKSAGVNFAVLDLKNESGKLNYASKIDDAVKHGLVASQTDVSAVAAKLKEAGITPCARICCFKDPATSAAISDAAVMYSKVHSYRWLDVSRNSWLNPYSDHAQQYLISVMKEAVSMGFTVVMLDSVEFPNGGSSTWFGNSTVSKEDTLKNFVTLAAQQVGAAGGKVMLHLPGSAAVGTAVSSTGQDQGVFNYGSQYVSPDLTASSFQGALKLGAASIANPSSDPGATVSAIIQYLAGQNGKDKISTLVPTIQTSGLSPAQVNAEIAALGGTGSGGYILGSTDGSYNFSGYSLK